MNPSQIRRVFALLPFVIAAFSAHPARAEAPASDTSTPIFPGQPGVRPFWNKFAGRFIYAPAFDIPETPEATSYRFSLKTPDNQTPDFTAGKPWSPLSSVWDSLPEGFITLSVQPLDAHGAPVGKPIARSFYKSPGFTGTPAAPLKPYADAGQWALSAIYRAPHVQHWLSDPKPDRAYDLYCYPPKVMGALIRAMVAYSKVAPQDKDNALQIARRTADYLISISTPDAAPYPHFPPTYITDVDQPLPAAAKRTGKWLFIPAAVDAALGYLDLYDATNDHQYFTAATAIADTYLKTQGNDGTWPIMVDFPTGKPLYPNRQNATWIISLFDRLADQYHLTTYRTARDRAWQYIVDNPLKTYRWEGQFEDGTPREPYRNLAREQACDVACMLLDHPASFPNAIATAEELLRFSEDQFVVWSPIKDPSGWLRAMPTRRKNVDQWTTPCTLEQYGAYAPVARSSAIVINTCLKAYHVTGKPLYLAKARALANGLIAAQAWMADKYHGDGEIPTWLTGAPPRNWLNNSFYASQALLAVAAESDTK